MPRLFFDLRPIFHHCPSNRVVSTSVTCNDVCVCVDTTMGAKKEARKEKSRDRQSSLSKSRARRNHASNSSHPSPTRETHSWAGRVSRSIEQEINHRTWIAGTIAMLMIIRSALFTDDTFCVDENGASRSKAARLTHGCTYMGNERWTHLARRSYR